MSVAAVGTLLPACSNGNPSGPSATVPALPLITGSLGNGAVTVTVDSASPLASVGGAALVQSSVGNFLVSHTGQDTFVALTATCTHQTCTVTGFENSRYVCPCHGSQFTTAGAVAAGPATRALQQFATQFTAPTLIITA
jgi:cytochrome b6-f complex iron-sulfur subunit